MKVSSGLEKVMELAAAERERLLARAYRTEDEADRIALAETEYARDVDTRAMLAAMHGRLQDDLVEEALREEDKDDAVKNRPEEGDRSKGGDR